MNKEIGACQTTINQSQTFSFLAKLTFLQGKKVKALYIPCDITTNSTKLQKFKLLCSKSIMSI